MHSFAFERTSQCCKICHALRKNSLQLRGSLQREKKNRKRTLSSLSSETAWKQRKRGPRWHAIRPILSTFLSRSFPFDVAGAMIDSVAYRSINLVFPIFHLWCS